ncbi:sugar ABC transporter permease [Paenibacillus sp. F411]|uniref:ABC transporter permease n=1 Tax=Paenibacillus sp. F411 TaxID=2820239 RepID=UPI001AAF109C|nr:ABC transporter permease subunit [Paenibacillus sp. F411]MBO2942418.1 sugar ABC transporter permease [Paenibacillus sp. F411]
MKNHKALYFMLVPGLLYLLVFKYIPLLGSVIAFQDFNVFKGFLKSDWVGFRWFEQFLTFPQFTRLLKNTLIISLYQILFAFPAPIILAVLLNEVRKMAFKRFAQTVLYLPHFLSWVLIGGLSTMLFSQNYGLVNQLIENFGGDKVNFLLDSDYIRTIIVSTGIWKEMGWSAIIFLAALAGINPSLYEAAGIDGAGRFKQFLHVSLPGMMPAIVILLLLKIGHILDNGFEQVYVFLTPATFDKADVLDTFMYRMGIRQSMYSLTTAVGLFKSVVGLALLVIANRFSKKITGEGLY